MGLKAGGTNSNVTYISTYGGDLVIQDLDLERLTDKLDSLGFDPEKVQSRTISKGKNEGKEMNYFVVNEVSGMLEGIKIVEADWGDVVDLHITDIDEKFVISIGDVLGRLAQDMTRRLDGLDLTSEVAFKVWRFTDDKDKTRSGVSFYQDGEKVEYAIPYEDMPEPVKKKVGRKVEWDYSERSTFLYDRLSSYIEENFKVDASKEDQEDREAEAKKAETKKAKGRTRKNAIEGPDQDKPPF